MQSRIRLISILISAAILGSSACGAMPAPPATPTLVPTETIVPTPGPSRLETGEIMSQALANNLLGDAAKRKFQVYLPPGYDASNQRYPVVYVLHWYTGTYITFSDTTSASLEALIASHNVKPMILVFPDASNKLGGSMYRSSATIGDYETYLAKELVQQIDATYRTLPDRESRGVMGCSMGGMGAIHLGLKYPDVFSVAAPMSASAYDFQDDPAWRTLGRFLMYVPQNMDDFRRMPLDAKFLIAMAAATAPNPDKPPFYLDMPFKDVGGKVEIAPEVFDKLNAVDPMSDVRPYLAQPVRLRGLLIYNDTDNGISRDEAAFELQAVHRFEQTLSTLGISHQYTEIDAQHCNFTSRPSWNSWVPI
jgi:pimeloyl-ACP methyl ester carboxylesterase